MKSILFMLTVTIATFSALARSRAVAYVTPEFWTHVKVDHCKVVSDTLMHCEADITFAGYTVKKPSDPTIESVPKAKFTVEQ